MANPLPGDVPPTPTPVPLPPPDLLEAARALAAKEGVSPAAILATGLGEVPWDDAQLQADLSTRLNAYQNAQTEAWNKRATPLTMEESIALGKMGGSAMPLRVGSQSGGGGGYVGGGGGGGIASQPNSTSIGQAPTHYATPSGVQGTILDNPAFAAKSWQDAAKYPDPITTAHVRDDVMAAEFGNPEHRNLTDLIIADKEHRGNPVEEFSWWALTLGGLDELFDAPRKYAWLTATGLANFLPKGSAAVVVDHLDALASAAYVPVNALGKIPKAAGDAIANYQLEHYPEEMKREGQWWAEKLAPILEYSRDNLSFMGDKSALTPEAREALLAQIGNNLQEAAGNGAILKASEEHPGFFTWGRTRSALGAVVGDDWADVLLPGGRTRNIRGRDLLDVSISKEDAKRLYADANARGDEGAKALYSSLSTEFGRELYGVALDMTLDPLWFTGAAEGSKILQFGDRTLRASPVVVRVARLLETSHGSWEEAVRVVARATQGDAEAVSQVKSALEGLATRTADARQALTELRQAGPKATLEGARRQVADLRASVSSLEQTYQGAAVSGDALPKARETLKAAEALLTRIESAPAKWQGRRIRQLEQAVGRGESALKDGSTVLRGGPGLLTVPGLVAFSTAERTVEAGGVLRDLARAGSEAVYRWTQPFHLATLDRKILEIPREVGSLARRAEKALTPAERLAWTAMHTARTSPLVTLPQEGWRLLTMALGTRFIEPWAMATDRWLRLWNRDEGALRLVVDRAIEGGRQIGLPGVPKEQWANYQESLSRLFDTLGSREAYLKGQLMRVKRIAHDVLHARQDMYSRWVKAGKPGAVLPERWGSETYTHQDVIDEAANLIETGAGHLQARPELAPLIQHVEALRDQLVDTVPAVHDVTQSVLRIARTLQGDPEYAAAMLKRLQAALDHRSNLAQEAADLERRQSTALDALAEATPRRDALESAFSRLDEASVATALLRASKAHGGNPPSSTVIQLIEAEMARVSSARGLPYTQEQITATVSDMFRALGRAWGTGGASLSPAEVSARLLREAAESVGKGDATLDTLTRGLKLLRDRVNARHAAAIDALLHPESASARLLTSDLVLRRARMMELIEKATPAGKDAKVFKGEIIDLLKEATSANPGDSLEKLKALLGERTNQTVLGVWTALVTRLNTAAGVESRIARSAALWEKTLGASGTNLWLVDSFIDHALRGKTAPEAAQAALEAAKAALPASMTPQELLWLLKALEHRLAHVAEPLREAVGASVKGLRDEAVSRVQGLQDDLRAVIEPLLKDRKQRLVEADEAVETARKAWIESQPTVARAPGEVDEAGKAVGANNFVGADQSRRAATEWEQAVWRKFQAVRAGYTDEEALTAAFALLRDAPEIPGTVGHMGRRMGDMPADMKELTYAMESTFQQFEEWLRASGLNMSKDPVERMKAWGTVGYTPHIRVEAEAIAAEGPGAVSLRGSAARNAGTARLDAQLSLTMDASHLRRIAGTVAEINAAGSEVSMHFGLDAIMARYLQAVKATGAAEFLAFMIRGGVVEKVEPIRNTEGLIEKGLIEQALDRGLVPLFTKPNLRRDLDVLMLGKLEDWQKIGVTAEELEEASKALRVGKGKSEDLSPFATWLGGARLAQQTANVESLFLEARRESFQLGKALWEPTGNWFEDAHHLNGIAARLGLPHVSEDALRAYWEEQHWRLFVPGRVYESMARIFEETAPAKGTLAHLGKKVLDATNRIYKTWATVTQIAFSVRNAMGNALANMIDIGPHGVFSPVTNYDANRLYMAYLLVEQHGSLTKAREAMGVGRWVAEFAGVNELWRNGIDLGDGVIRPAEDALKILAEKEALSRAYTHVGDLGSYDSDLAEAVLRFKNQPLQSLWKAFKENGPALALSGVGYAVGGVAGAPVVLPPKLGAYIARYVEGHARLVNFLANVRRGGSFTEAGLHVKQFLFDYEDLSNMQKTWVRSIIPFFTWTQKNILLHSEMMFEKPWYYQRFGQLFTRDLPTLSSELDRDLGYYSDYPVNVYDEREQVRRSAYLWGKASLPVPAAFTGGHPYLWVTGLGSPIEAALDTAGMLLDIVNAPKIATGDYRGLRLLSMMSWAVNVPAALVTDQDFYYGRRIEDMNTADKLLAWLHALKVTREKAPPGLKFLYGLLYGASETVLNPTITVDPFTTRETATADPIRLWALNATPFTVALRRITALSDAYSVALTTSPADLSAVYRIPDWARVLNAFAGLNLVQDDQAAHHARWGRDLLQEQADYYKRIGWGRERESVVPR